VRFVRSIGAGRGTRFTGVFLNSFMASGTAQRPFEVVERKRRSGEPAAIDRRGNAERANQRTPSARADQRPDLLLLEIIRQRIAARQLVDKPAVVLDPGERAQRVLARHRHYRDDARAIR